MGSSVAPARRTDEARSPHGNLELVSYISSVAPETPLLSNPHSLIRERREDRVAVFALSATAGYIDALGFLMLFGLFPAHVTGELVGLTTAFTAGHVMSHPGRYAVIPVFVLALFLAAIVARSRRNCGKSPRRALLGLLTLALGLCALTGFWQPGHAAAVKQAWMLGLRECSVVAAMAFQNAFMRESLTSACPTTVMTGNLTQFAFELVDMVALRFGWDRTETTRARVSRSRFWLVTSALGAFLGGAVLGGYLTGIVGAFGTVLPMFAVLLLARRTA
jgi:uncharacterized membrane protein YoaK (UPF0700 family)